MKISKFALIFSLFIALLSVSCAKKKKESLNEKVKMGDIAIEEAFRKAEQYAANKRFMSARAWYRLIEAHAPNSPYFGKAKLGIADSYFFDRTATSVEASIEYKSYLTHFPNSPIADYCQYQHAMCFFTEIENAKRDQTSTWTAYNEFKKVIDTFPGSPYAIKAKEKMNLCLFRIAQHEFEVGYYYYRRGPRFEISAEARFKNLIDEYEGYFDQERTYFYLGETLWRLKKYDEAIRYFQYLARNHQEGEYAPFVFDKLRRYEKISEEGTDPGLTEDLGTTPTEEKNL